jgi:bifunctional non-homologous end joining protein LigD
MLCESAERLPEESEWRYELKLDGFRAIGRKSGRSAQLWSRNQKDFTRRFPDVVRGIAELPSDTVIDGEIVALDASGKPLFNLSSRALGVERQQSCCMPSIRSCCGARMRGFGRSNNAANSFVRSCNACRKQSAIRNLQRALSELIREVRQHQLEGIVAKRAGSEYRSGARSGDRIKWRANRGQEFVIEGYIPNGHALDSILVGYYNRPPFVNVCVQSYGWEAL